MNTIKLGSKGEDVKRLCQLLGISERTEATKEVIDTLKEFQKAQGLQSDGICGKGTWKQLFISQRLKLNSSLEISDLDYEWAGEYLGCEPLVVKALVNVETGGKSGFDSPGKPQILFEGHVFWKNLKSAGINPEPISKTYPSICYPSWTKDFYLGGSLEWQRFDIASIINKKCALMSTSYGLFQILGQNFKSCDATSVEEFYEGMCKSQFQQFIYGISFLRNSGIYSHMAKKDFAGIARQYNGSGQVSVYSKKLETEYNKLVKAQKK